MAGRPPKLIDEAQERRLVAAYKTQEVTVAQLSRRFRITEKRVAEILNSHGVERHNKFHVRSA